ncbi:MAG: zinc ribbon domain-containing protein [Methanocella sp.]
MNSRVKLLMVISVALFLISLPFWFIALMALIAGRAWSIAFILIGLVILGMSGAALYMAYSIIQTEKMAGAREHNMERQVVAVSKKKNGIVTVTDMVAIGFNDEDAEKVLDHLARKGVCFINLDATKYMGVKTYMFPQDVRMRCPYCGTPIDINAIRCPSCGAPVEWRKMRPPEEPEAEKQ